MKAIWIDPNYLERIGGWQSWTVTTTNTTEVPAASTPVDEDRIREIVRQEIAELPIKYDVPDSP
jgi:hypothetical protein